MKEIQETLTCAMLHAQTEQEFLSSLVRVAHRLGFEYCAYGLRVPLPVSEPRVHMVSNYADDWQRRYLKQQYFLQDPVVQHCSRSNLPIIWSDELFTHCHEFWYEAKSFGLHTGWSQSCHNAQGVGGMLTLARSFRPLTWQDINEYGLVLSWMNAVSFEGMSRILLPKLMPCLENELSGREREVLRWTADGKTANDVSKLMKITERTVNFHMNNAMEKLGVSNKTAAVVRAAALGVL